MMKIFLAIVATLLLAASSVRPSSSQVRQTGAAYLGFDCNDYPGDSNLKTLRQSFLYSGYWLNHPPGSKTNSWIGKRKTLQAAGFGFLVLFNGRTYEEIKRAGDASKLGKSDAATAVRSARVEGFPPRTIIFLDQEQGGRMLAEQRAYLHAWIDAVNSANFEAGVYCSGIAAQEGAGVSVVTADDIRKHAAGRQITYWVVNDSCPPSPGCTISGKDLLPATSRISFGDVWQFAQSPKRPDFARGCPANYNKDGNCYPPGADPALGLHVDLNVATSADPSHGRTRE